MYVWQEDQSVMNVVFRLFVLTLKRIADLLINQAYQSCYC